MFERHLVPIYLPRGFHKLVRTVKRAIVAPKKNVVIDLSGERDIEWSYIGSRLPMGNGYVFDFGCGYGNLSIHAIQKGHRVLALDLETNRVPWSHPNWTFVCGDLLKLDLPDGQFDYVLNCSSVEHVGLSGRYGVAVPETDGDLAAMQRMRRLLKPGGRMILTLPCGQDAVIAPWHRVYGKERLPRLQTAYEVQEQCFWVKQEDNCWHPCQRETALSYVPTCQPKNPPICSYALGCFVLGRGS